MWGAGRTSPQSGMHMKSKASEHAWPTLWHCAHRFIWDEGVRQESQETRRRREVRGRRYAVFGDCVLRRCRGSVT